MKNELGSENYFVLYSDCIPVRGSIRSAIYDLTRHELILFPTSYFDILTHLIKHPLRTTLDQLKKHPLKQTIKSFIKFLEDNELGTTTTDPSVFVPIEVSWDHPAQIHNAITGIRRMNAPIRPSSSSIVQESVAKCEVVHTSVKIFPRIVGQASAIVWFLGFHDKKP
jgi:hypothetical protein